MTQKSTPSLYILKITESRSTQKTYTRMFIAALFITTKKLKQSKCALTDKWISKMWYIYTIE